MHSQPPIRPLNDSGIGLRVLAWLGVPAACIAVCAFGGATLGTVIGDALGSPEGEGFIGFIYGLRAGGAVGALLGAFAAWRVDRSIRRSRT